MAGSYSLFNANNNNHSIDWKSENEDYLSELAAQLDTILNFKRALMRSLLRDEKSSSLNSNSVNKELSYYEVREKMIRETIESIKSEIQPDLNENRMSPSNSE